MHFTREPIIETVITARDGFKLSVRNSKGSAHEEYTVEAVEVVSFGTALFFRCLEKPKAFLLPVSDYEVLETKETRVLLKSASVEKSIKIGGGREAPLRNAQEREVVPEKELVETPSQSEEGSEVVPTEQRVDKRRDRRRHRRRRSGDERHEMKEWTEKKHPEETTLAVVLGGDAPPDETPPTVSSPLFGTLIPPPTTLISETLARYKDTLIMESSLSTAKVNEPPLFESGQRDMEHEASSHIHLTAPEEDSFFP
ncbi:MAG: hypothetical protein KGZ39_05435 [Simkania sp.]|nr:hypothetical protein [Simkania sp.]